MDDSNDDRVAKRAYALWEQEGWPHGRELDHWDQAMKEIEEGPAEPHPEVSDEVGTPPAPLESPSIAPDTLNEQDRPVAPKMRGMR
ncbi:MAG: DUF2934 domain-containing protein [Allorhizobium sp.]